MGHYYGEMACSICGKIPCSCPREPNPDLNKWIVTNDFTVMTIATHDEKYKYIQTKYGPIPGHPWARRQGKDLFDTEQEALDNRVAVVDQFIEFATATHDSHKIELDRLLKIKQDLLNE